MSRSGAPLSSPDALQTIDGARTPVELQAVVAALRGQDHVGSLGVWDRFRAAIPRESAAEVGRAVWNAGHSSLFDLLGDRRLWGELRRSLPGDEEGRLFRACRDVVRSAMAELQLEHALDERAAWDEVDQPLPGTGCPREELDAWAAAVGATSLLDETVVDALHGSDDHEVMAFLRRSVNHALRVGDALAGPDWGAVNARPRKTGAPAPIQEAARSWLRRAVAARAVAKEDDARRLAELAETTPDVESLRGLDTRLLALRASLVEAVGSRPALARRPVGLRVVDEPPRLELRPSQMERRCTRQPEVTIPLTGRLISCGCAAKPAACRSWLDAVDASLDMLRKPGKARDAARALLERPRWTQAVNELEQLVAGVDDAEPIELGWRLGDLDTHTPTVTAVGVTPMKSGGFRTRALQTDEEARALLASPREADRRVAAMRPRVHDRQDPLDLARGGLVLRELVGHPRVFVGSRARVPSEVRSCAAAVVVGRGEALTVRIHVDGTPLEPDQLAALADVRWAKGPPVLESPGLLRVLEAGAELRALAGHLLRHGEELDPDATEPVLEAVHQLESAVPVELDATLRGQQDPADQRLLLRLELRRDGGLNLSMRTQPQADGPVLQPGVGRRFVHRRQGAERSHVQRDLLAERTAAVDLATRLGLDDPDAPECDWSIASPTAAAEAVATLESLAASGALRVEWTGRPLQFTKVTSRSLRISVQPMERWFALDGRLEVADREVELRELLTLLESGRRFVPVGEHDWARIDDSLAAALAKATAGAFLERGQLRMSPLHAPSLEGLSRAGVRIEAAPEWVEAKERVAAANAADLGAVEGLQADLRPYQADGVAWIRRCTAWSPGCVLADDMGLGKTVQALGVLLSRAEQGPALVVAPASVGFGWLEEAERFAPSLRARAYRGAGREELLDGLGAGDVLVTSWALLVRDAELLRASGFATVVLDEAQAAKNPDSARAAAAAGLRRPDGGTFVLALTGTPVENRPEELWSLMTLVAPGLLGGREWFRRRFARPIQRGEEEPRARLAELVRPLLLRRLKGEVAKDLPPRTEVEVRVQLGVDERAVYDRVRRAGLSALALRKGSDLRKDDQLRFAALTLLTKLRRAACHPRLAEHDSEVPSAKLARVRELVAELRDGGHQALVFSQFLAHLGIVREALEEDGCRVRYLDGSTPVEKRAEEVKRFQAGDGDVFLISLKAGGVGLNLTAATYVLHLDPWWNPAAEDQATDRAHRIGQDQPVTVYRLIARDTVEEAVVALHRRKRELVESLLAGTGQAASLGTEEILELLGG